MDVQKADERIKKAFEEHPEIVFGQLIEVSNRETLKKVIPPMIGEKTNTIVCCILLPKTTPISYLTVPVDIDLEEMKNKMIDTELLMRNEDYKTTTSIKIKEIEVEKSCCNEDSFKFKVTGWEEVPARCKD